MPAQNQFSNLQEFLSQKEPEISDFQALAVVPHSDARKISFAELTGYTGRFQCKCLCGQTFLRFSARRRDRRSPRDQLREGPFGPRDPALWGLGIIRRAQIARSGRFSAAMEVIISRLVSKSSAIQANNTSIAGSFGESKAPNQKSQAAA